MAVLYESQTVRVVEEHGDRGDRLRGLFVAPAFEAPIGLVKIDDPSFHVQEYTRQLTYAALCAPQGIRRALFLGLGAGIVVNAVRALFPEATIDIVDVIAEMFEVSNEHFFDIHAANVNLIHDSALPFVLQGGHRYDYVCCDIYNADLDIPFFLFEPDLYRGMKAITSVGGICAVNTSALIHKSVAEHLTTYYAHVVSLRGDNTLLIASDSQPRVHANSATLASLSRCNVDIRQIEAGAMTLRAARPSGR